MQNITVPTKPGYLVHGVNGKVRSNTLCTSTIHAINIFSDLFGKLDPFVRGSSPIAWVDQDEEGTATFSYKPR